MLSRRRRVPSVMPRPWVEEASIEVDPSVLFVAVAGRDNPLGPDVAQIAVCFALSDLVALQIATPLDYRSPLHVAGDQRSRSRSSTP